MRGKSDAQLIVTATYHGLKPGRCVLRARFVGTDYDAATGSQALRVTLP